MQDGQEVRGGAVLYRSGRGKRLTALRGPLVVEGEPVVQLLHSGVDGGLLKSLS